jgi:hypothetical protein
MCTSLYWVTVDTRKASTVLSSTHVLNFRAF